MRRCALLLLAIAPACADDVVCPSAGDFALTAPDGFAELVPGATVMIGWAADGDSGADVELQAFSTDQDVTIALPPALLGDGQLAWNGGDAPPGNYRLGGTVARIAQCEGLTITPDDLHLVVVQGLRLPTAALAFTGAQSTRTINVTTVTRSTLMVRYVVDPDLATGGDELAFAQATIPGELVAVPRSYPFTGMTTTGAAIPAGTYTLAALVGDPLAYRVDGPSLTWTP